MSRTILVVAAALSSISFSPRHAEASEAPWCAVINYGEYWDCQYRSLEECRPNAVAKRGWCNPSPYYVGQPRAEP
jgi:Protein of unknown function (DUF3551)